MTSLLLRLSVFCAAATCAGCTAPAERAGGGAQPSALSDSGVVSLRYTTLTAAGWVAVVEMRDRFFQNDIAVAYDAGSAGWIERPGRRAADLAGARSIWIVDQLPALEPLRFAVHDRAVTSGGLPADAWDNHGGANYSAARGAAALGDGVDIAVTRAAVNHGTLSASLLIRNRAYEKHVSILYSSDGWATAKTAGGRFVDGDGTRDAGESWTVDAPLEPNATRVAFAARVEQDGRDAWDNDDQRNFECDKDASGAWSCAGATLAPP